MLLLAPTGKARVQLGDKVGARALTLAQYLRRSKRWDDEFGYRILPNAKRDSGVATVVYEMRPTGSASFSSIGSSGSAPWQATWNAASLSSGSYDLRIVVTDRAGNVYHSPSITVAVDATPPGVSLDDPGALLSATVTLSATTTGNGATSVVFGISPAGGSSWTNLGTDTSAPWSVAFDTTTVPDGIYDLHAKVFDGVGNWSSGTTPETTGR